MWRLCLAFVRIYFLLLHPSIPELPHDQDFCNESEVKEGGGGCGCRFWELVVGGLPNYPPSLPPNSRARLGPECLLPPVRPPTPFRQNVLLR
ncbi:hypothetical protein FN846DRAFT_982109 [Sphaerosporella brunnea]|uniref:Secreted protein n=1 Tax=Sphaerosporella brunnea TaxID=1250544 RepID=A0A5J5EBA7_9PEZI|nr:hypothetical protein FN846DRAFT_982109 [Sphaerosporella brunnea]